MFTPGILLKVEIKYERWLERWKEGRQGEQGQGGTDGFQFEQWGRWGSQSLPYEMQLETAVDRVQRLRFGDIFATQ